jgi:hypothetical protein
VPHIQRLREHRRRRGIKGRKRLEKGEPCRFATFCALLERKTERIRGMPLVVVIAVIAELTLLPRPPGVRRTQSRRKSADG